MENVVNILKQKEELNNNVVHSLREELDELYYAYYGMDSVIQWEDVTLIGGDRLYSSVSGTAVFKKGFKITSSGSDLKNDTTVRINMIVPIQDLLDKKDIIEIVDHIYKINIMKADVEDMTAFYNILENDNASSIVLNYPIDEDYIEAIDNSMRNQIENILDYKNIDFSDIEEDEEPPVKHEQPLKPPGGLSQKKEEQSGYEFDLDSLSSEQRMMYNLTKQS